MPLFATKHNQNKTKKSHLNFPFADLNGILVFEYFTWCGRKGKKLSLWEFNNLNESGTREKDPVGPTGKMNSSTLILADNRSGQWRIFFCLAEVPAHRQKQLTHTLIVRLLKTHFFTLILDCEKSTEYNWVSDQTWGTSAKLVTSTASPTNCSRRTLRLMGSGWTTTLQVFH